MLVVQPVLFIKKLDSIYNNSVIFPAVDFFTSLTQFFFCSRSFVPFVRYRNTVAQISWVVMGKLHSRNVMKRWPFFFFLAEILQGNEQQSFPYQPTG